MAVAAPTRPAALVAAGPVRQQRRVTWLDRVTTAATGAGVAFIVAHDGTPVWRPARLVVTVGVAFLAWRAITCEQAARRISAGS